MACFAISSNIYLLAPKSLHIIEMYKGKQEFQGSTCSRHLSLYLAPPVQTLA